MSLGHTFFIRYRWLCLYMTAGLLLGVGVIAPAGWVLVLGGLCLYIYTLELKETTARHFYGSWLAWSIKYGVALAWFFTTYPLDWLGLPPGFLQYILISLYYIPAAITLGTGGLFVVFMYLLLGRYVQPWIRCLTLVPVLVLGEYIGAYVFSLYTYGQGGTLGADFTFGFVGYTAASHQFLLSLAAVGGLLLMSLVVALVAVLLLFLIVQNQWRWLGVAVLAVVSLSQWSLLTPYESTGEHRVVTMQMLWPRGTPEDVDNLSIQKAKQIETALIFASRLDPTHVILPEDARLTDTANHESTREQLVGLFGEQTTIIDTARIDGTELGTVLRAYVYDTSRPDVATFDKQYLVPQGEYVPFVYQQLIALLPLDPDTKNTIAGTRYVPGVPSRAVSVPSGTPAVLFCFESVTPSGVGHSLVNRDEVPFVAHVVSHAWFQQTPYQLWHQLDAMLQVQAVSAGLPIVQSANAAPAKVYYPDGSIVYPPLQYVDTGIALSLINL